MHAIRIFSAAILQCVVATAASADPPPWTNLEHWHRLRANPTLANAKQLLGEPTDRVEMGNMIGLYFGGRADEHLAYVAVLDDKLWISSPEPAKLDKWLRAKDWAEAEPFDDLSKWGNPAAWEPLKGGVAPSLVIERLGPPTWFVISPQFEQWSYGRYAPVRVSGEVLIMEGKVALVKPPDTNALQRLSVGGAWEDAAASSHASRGGRGRAVTASSPSMDSAEPKNPTTRAENAKPVRTEATTLPAHGRWALPGWVSLPKEVHGSRYVVVCLGLDDWCPPCVQLARQIPSLRDRFQDSHIGFVGGISDLSGSPDNMPRQEQKGIPLLDRGTTTRLLKHLNRDAIPFAVIVDANKNMLWDSGDAGVNADELEAFLAAIPLADEAQDEQWRRQCELRMQGRALVQQLGIAKEFNDHELMLEITRKLADLDRFHAERYAAVAVSMMLKGDARSEKEAWDYGLSLFRKHGYLQPLVEVIVSEYIRKLAVSEQIRCYEELASLGSHFGREAVTAYKIRNDMVPERPPTVQDGKRLIDKYNSNHQAMCDLVDYLLKQRRETRDLNLALQAVLAANHAADGRDADTLALVATVCFEAGDMHEAVRHQAMAVENESQPERKTTLNKRLEYYRLKLKQAAGAALPPPQPARAD